MESSDQPASIAHPLCPPHLRKRVEEVAESLNLDLLLPPKEDEVFESSAKCFQRPEALGFYPRLCDRHPYFWYQESSHILRLYASHGTKRRPVRLRAVYSIPSGGRDNA
jgi:hypothetical protein